QAALVVGQPPSFTGIAEVADELERIQVVHEAGLGLPCQLEQLSRGDGDPFSEIPGWDLQFLNHLSRFELHLPDGRVTNLARAFIKKAVAKFQALRECGWVVRIRPHNRESRNWRLRAWRRECLGLPDQ